MWNNRKLYVYQSPDGDAGGGAAGGGGGAQQPFADAAAARAYLKDYVNDEAVLTAVPEEKVVPWATHVKSKLDTLGTQFPVNWRDQVAGDDKNHLKTLEKFASPRALYQSYAALQQKLGSGELRPVAPFPDKGTPEDQKAWRLTNGVPETHEEYVKGLKLPQGLVLGEEDKPTLESFAKYAHGLHFRPEHVSGAMAWYLQEKTARTEAQAESDETNRMAGEDALRAEWGADYRGNIARINGFLDTAPKGVKEFLIGARAADKTPLMNHPDTLRWLADLARQMNPAGVVLPGSGGNMATSVEDEIKEIETFMRTNRSAYNKDAAKQARLRDLYGARDKIAGKKAA